MRLRYTRSALAELGAILDQIATHSPQASRRVRAQLRAVIDLLRSHPHIGTRTDDPSIRRLSATPYPYLVFYEIGQAEVVIHAIRHGARDPSGMPGAG